MLGQVAQLPGLAALLSLSGALPCFAEQTAVQAAGLILGLPMLAEMLATNLLHLDRVAVALADILALVDEAGTHTTHLPMTAAVGVEAVAEVAAAEHMLRTIILRALGNFLAAAVAEVLGF